MALPMTLSHIDRVTKVEERFTSVHVSGIGKEAVFRSKSIGWWITLSSGVSLYVGEDSAGFKERDKVKLTLGRMV
jgi:hypothetical protein